MRSAAFGAPFSHWPRRWFGRRLLLARTPIKFRSLDDGCDNCVIRRQMRFAVQGRGDGRRRVADVDCPPLSDFGKGCFGKDLFLTGFDYFRKVRKSRWCQLHHSSADPLIQMPWEEFKHYLVFFMNLSDIRFLVEPYKPFEERQRLLTQFCTCFFILQPSFEGWMNH